MLPSLDRPIVVEGKYDRLRLMTVVSGTILTTDGFGVFRSDEKKLLIRRLAEKNGILVLTDADGAGLVIRNFLSGILPREQITHLYVPAVPGKEKRKQSLSRAGLIGVEGMEKELLLRVLEPYFAGQSDHIRGGITKADFYADGFSGGADSREKRKQLAKKLDLPDNLSANALLEAINLLLDRDEYERLKETAFD